MKKKLDTVFSILCYLLGTVGAIYIGGYWLLLRPIHWLMLAFQTGTLTMHILIVNLIKIALSTTVGGMVWCAGYIGYNHFIGTEDEYDRLMKQLEEERKARKAARLENKKLKNSKLEEK